MTAPARRAMGGSAIRSRSSQIALTAVAFVLGLLVVVQLRTQTGAGGSALQNKSAQDLTTLVGNLDTENDRLRAEVSSLQGQLGELRADRSSGATSIGQIQSDLARIRAWSGLDPVAGRGVIVTVSGQLTARAVDDLVNELRNAGAEAVAIENVRIVVGTAVSGVPGSLDVDGFLLPDPFRVRAIGRPDTLVGSLTRAGGIVAQLAATNPSASIDLEPTDQPMTLPATQRGLSPVHGHPAL